MAGMTELLLEIYPVEAGRPLDLGGVLLVTSTGTGGRRLREALAWEVRKRGGSGLFPPELSMPTGLFRRVGGVSPEHLPVASELQCLSVWTSVLEGLPLGNYQALFPRMPVARGMDWTMGQAKEFHGLRRELVQGGIGFEGVAGMDVSHCPERNRWQDLRELELLYLDKLASAGLADPYLEELRAVKEAALPGEVRKVILAGVTDLSPLVEMALENLESRQPGCVSIVTVGPDGGEGLFDDWGRPLRECWEERDTGVLESHLHLCLDEQEESGRIAAVLASVKDLGNRPAVGVADPELVPALRKACSVAGIKTYDPQGLPVPKHGLFDLLRTLSRLAERKDFHDVEQLLKFPLVARWFEKSTGLEPEQTWRYLDDARQSGYPSSLEAFLQIPRKEKDAFYKGLEGLGKRIDEMEEEGFVVKLRQWAGELFEGMEISDRTEKILLSKFADVLSKGMEDLESLPFHIPAYTAFSLLLDALSKAQAATEHDPHATEVQGWLEILWDPNPNLLLAGIQDGKVPQSVTADAFLPDSLREATGLQTNASRKARDTWLLATLQACRTEEGSLQVFMAKYKASGDPMLPSRILLQGLGERLPARVKALFKDVHDNRPRPAWSCPDGLKLQPPPLDIPRIRVTAFSAFLESPLLFWLNRDAEDLDARKSEMAAHDFGILLHEVFEKFSKDPGQASTNEQEVRQTLFKILDNIALNRFGTQPALAVQAQLSAVKERLGVAAKHQAACAQEGWRIVQSEMWMIGGDDSPVLEFDGTPVSGIIDRIDYHEGRNEYRVIDYKTSDTAKTPSQSHLAQRAASIAKLPEFAHFSDADGKDCAWRDLQLPLYVLWGKLRFPGANFSAAYFNLPATTRDSGIQLLDLSIDSLAAAGTCAKGVIRELKTNPAACNDLKVTNPAPHLEPFARLYFHSPAQTLWLPS